MQIVAERTSTEGQARKIKRLAILGASSNNLYF